MAEERISFVALEANENAPLGSKVYIPARIDKELRGTNVPNYRLRVLTIANRQQQVPSLIRDWMMGDARYKGWFDAAPVPALPLLETDEDEETLGGDAIPPVPPIELDPVPPLTEENEDEDEESESKPVDIFFEAWGREDIEDANLNGDEGLLAYAEYMGIDLGEATLKADVLAIILEWLDNALLS